MNAFGYFYRNKEKGGGGVSEEDTCAGEGGRWSGRRGVGPHRGIREPEAGVQVAPPRRWRPPAPHQVWAPSAGHQVREAPAQSGAWGGGLWHLWKLCPGRCGQRQKASGQRAAGGLLFLLSPETGGEAAWRRRALPGAPGGGRFWSPGQCFGWSSWQSGCGGDVNAGGAARRAKASLVRQV